MRVDSLERLSAEVAEWRRGKRHRREKMPETLVARARGAVRRHGLSTVVRVLKVDGRRLEGMGTTSEMAGREMVAAPAYSRVEMTGGSASSRPVAELELPSGVKLRVYSDSPQTLGLLSRVCGAGAER